MPRTLIAVALSLAWSTQAFAAPVVVWLEGTQPEEKVLRKVEGQLEGATHLSHVDLAFPPQPSSEQDETAYRELGGAMTDVRARWNDFDVELGFATSLDEAIRGIDVIRDEADLEALITARLLQGAAVSRAFSERDFPINAAAEPFRVTVPGAKVNSPWLYAIALEPARQPLPADFADGAELGVFQTFQERVSSFPMAYLDLGDLPRDVEVVLDGVNLGKGLQEIDVVVGDHYLHILRDGVIGGRQVIFADAGLTTDISVPVAQTEVARARELLLTGSTVGFPDDVRAAIAGVGELLGDDVYVAAVDGGRVVLEPYGTTREIEKGRVVTVLMTGDIGLGVVVSPIFDDSNGETVTAPGAHGGLGFEVGIYNAVILGGFDLAFVPTQTVTHGNKDETENVHTSVLPQPWGGLGGYILRPDDMHTTLLLAATYGWNGPAHMALGGRIVLGIPIDEEGTWFRLTVGGSSAAKSMWDTGNDQTPMSVLFLRGGFGTRF